MNNDSYHNPTTGKAFTSRRSGEDRRKRRSIFPISYFGIPRRKRGGRREGDVGYVDIYDFRTWSMVVPIILLSLIDAFLTHQHLIIGSAREANPIMQVVINVGGIPVFYLTKGLLTITAVVFIMIHKEWRLGKYAARFCLWAYIILSLYHLYLVIIVQDTLG